MKLLAPDTCNNYFERMSDKAEALLKLVAIRAAGELERLLADTELKKQAGELMTAGLFVLCGTGLLCL